MEWLHITAEAGLWGLLASSFLAATLLPGGSEALLFAFLTQYPGELWPALAITTLGNTLGGMTSYAGGRWLPQTKMAETSRGMAHLAGLRRWGSPVLLLAWAPVVGDLLCVAGGWLRLNWAACAAFMAMGKFARYWLVAQGAALTL